MVLIRQGRPLAMTACKVPMIMGVLDTQTAYRVLRNWCGILFGSHSDLIP